MTALRPECPANHPLEPEIPIPFSTGKHLCLPCTLTKVSHPTLLLANRQAALAELTPLQSEVPLLYSLDPSLLYRSLNRLLTVLFTDNTPDPLAHQLITFITQLCKVSDSATTTTRTPQHQVNPMSPTSYLLQLMRQCMDTNISPFRYFPLSCQQ